MKKLCSIKEKRIRWIVGLVLTGLVLILGKNVLLAAGMAVAVVTVNALNLENMFKNKKIIPWSIVFMSPFFYYFIMEILNDHYPWYVLGVSFVYNILIYISLILIFGAILNGVKRGCIGASVLVLVVGIINHFIRIYKNATFSIYDIRSAGTLMNVMGGGMELQTDVIIAAAVAAFGIYWLVLCKPYCDNKKTEDISKEKDESISEKTVRIKETLSWKCNWLPRLVCLAAGMLFWILIFPGDLMERSGVDCMIYHSAEKNGFAVHFIGGYKSSRIAEPEGYSDEEISGIMADIQKNSEEQSNEPGDTTTNKQGQSDISGDRPNVIVIMNESFADMSVIGDFETDIEVLPCYNSLKENTVKGYTLSSVYGGNTANSEWEFLTGNSMFFMPVGSIPFQTYLENDTGSIARLLGNDGYRCAAFHPYDSSGWSRKKAWGKLGFTETHFIEDFRKDNLISDKITDLSDFQQMMENYDANNDGTPSFLFNVTMQNHTGGYYDVEDQLGYKVHLLGDMKDKYGYVEGYLTLMHESDKALQWLINDLSGRDEKFVVLMFGDHQVSFGGDDTFLEDLYGKPLSSLSDEEKAKMYMTPFVIWANYDIQEKEVPLTSMNYLSTILLEASGIQESEYNKYLEILRQDYPAIHANGYFDAEQKYTTVNDYNQSVKQGGDKLQNYWHLIYNNMFDAEGYRADLFE